MSRLRLWFSGYDAEGLEFDHNWISTGSEFSCFIWFVLNCASLCVQLRLWEQSLWGHRISETSCMASSVALRASWTSRRRAWCSDFGGQSAEEQKISQEESIWQRSRSRDIQTCKPFAGRWAHVRDLRRFSWHRHSPAETPKRQNYCIDSAFVELCLDSAPTKVCNGLGTFLETSCYITVTLFHEAAFEAVWTCKGPQEHIARRACQARSV